MRKSKIDSKCTCITNHGYVGIEEPNTKSLFMRKLLSA